MVGLTLLCGFFLRISYAVNGHKISSSLWSDMVIYFRISEKIENGQWEAQHFFQSIGYPLLINALKSFESNIDISLGSVQALASCLTLFLFYRIVSACTGKRTGLICLLIGSIHFPWILYINYTLPETMFTLMLAISGWYAWKLAASERPGVSDAILWATSFMMAFWLKGTHAFWGPLFLLTLVITKKRPAFNAAIAIIFIVSIGFLAHGFLSLNKVGKFQMSASTGGLNFVEGKCPSKVNHDSIGYRWQSPLYYQLGINTEKYWPKPFTESGHYFKEGLKCIQENPFVLIQSFESIAYLFMGNTMWPFNKKPEAPYTRLYELIFAVFIIAGLAGYFIRLFRGGVPQAEFTTFVIPVLALFLCVYIFKSEIRYRVPFDLWLIPMGVIGWSHLFNKR